MPASVHHMEVVDFSSTRIPITLGSKMYYRRLLWGVKIEGHVRISCHLGAVSLDHRLKKEFLTKSNIMYM